MKLAWTIDNVSQAQVRMEVLFLLLLLATLNLAMDCLLTSKQIGCNTHGTSFLDFGHTVYYWIHKLIYFWTWDSMMFLFLIWLLPEVSNLTLRNAGKKGGVRQWVRNLTRNNCLPLLSIVFTNVQSLKNKTDELQACVSSMH